MKELREILRKPNCTKCELHKTAQHVCLIGSGPHPSKIMIVGEAPGKREDQDMNKPFAGKAGKILDVILESLGLDREEIYITNVVHCRPPENRTPTMEEIRTCREYLLKEISYVKPRIIITLGNIALKGLMDNNLFSISRERGKILEFEGAKVIPTYHPAAALRKKYFANLIFSDIKNGLKLIKEKVDIKVNEKGKYELIDSKNVAQVTSELMKEPRLSLDIETSGLDLYNKDEELISCSISPRPKVSYVFKLYQDKWILEHVKKILANDNLKVLINHNIKFDLQWLERYGIKYDRRIFDTLVAKHLLDENCPDKSLKSLARTELGMLDLSYAEDTMIKHRKDKTAPSWKEMLRYNGGDSDATFRLYEKYKEQLKKEDLLDLMKQEMIVLQSLKRMEMNGFKIDLERHKILVKEYEGRIEETKKDFKRIAGDVNLNSPIQLRDLFDRMKLPVTKKSPKGERSCDEASLQLLLSEHELESDEQELVQLILDYRGLDKIYKTYLIGLDSLIKPDGMVHCNFKITGTVTGRLSCSEPNLQQIPRNGEVKSMFISRFKKGRIIQVDYSQIELRGLAEYADDENLIEAFKNGRDIHQETASKCLHKPYDQVTEEERKIIGKRVNFGIVYLISAPGLAEKLPCSIEEAREYISNWFKPFRKVKEWMNYKREEIIKTGKSKSLFGRVRRLYGVDMETPEGREAVRQGTNAPIQGFAGDLTKYNMSRLERRLLKEGMKARVISNVHDAVMIDSPKEEVEKTISLIDELFSEAPMKLSVPLEFEIKVGKNWKEMTTWKRK